ncbi:MAG: peptidoglycan-binding protein [candidate division Zixibacteria bacterium]|nr:peptidoglycan-binding protein [candidate division Zixibacteria bacterium]
MPRKRYYTVKPGDWLSKISRKFGINDWHVIYDHPQNKGFKKKRPDPNTIYPGDIVYIPDPEYIELQPKRKHANPYEIKAVPPKWDKIELVMRDVDGKVIANEPYNIKIGGYSVSGTTDGDGKIEETVIPELLDYGSYELEFKGTTRTLRIGHVDSIDELSGVLQRLENLGYITDMKHARKRPERYIKRFQTDNGLEATGEMDDDTRNKLDKAYQGK